MKKLRAAVIGVGYLGNFHAQKYKAHPQIDLVGVFDLNREQAQRVAQDLQVSTINKLEDLVGKIDLATVATTTKSHFEVAEFLLHHKIHLNIEKPITAELDQAKKLIELARTQGVKLAVGHIERFNPAFLKWRLMMGIPTYIEFERFAPFKTRGSDVSVIHDLMIHDLDLLLSLQPGVLKNIEVQGGRVKSSSFDWAQVWLSFGSRLKVCLKASRVSPVASRKIRSYESSSWWSVDLQQGELEQVSYGEGISTPLVTHRFVTEKVDALQKETDSFVEAVLHNKEPLLTGEDGLAALSLVERICSELNHVS